MSKNFLLRILLPSVFSVVLLNGLSVAGIITVDDDHAADFKTIQEAVNAAAENDTISVMPGTYRETITLPARSLALIGTAPESTIIKNAQKYYPILSGTGNYVIKNFSIIGDGDIGSGINVQTAWIENNIVEYTGSGILQFSGMIRNNILRNNRYGIFTAIRFHPIPLPGQMIIEGNEIYDNDFGIRCEISNDDPTADSIVVRGNTIRNNIYGIYYEEPIPIGKSYRTKNHTGDYPIDARWNWWGTTVKDTIAKYIFDQNDAFGNRAVVDFSGWLQDVRTASPVSDTMGIHYNNIYNNTTFNLLAHIPIINAIDDDNGRGATVGSFTLFDNYPNPFNPSTTIRFSIAKESPVSLKVFDVLGREVARLVDGRKDPGAYTITWSPGHLSSGVYFCCLRAAGHTQVKKMLYQQ